MTTNDNLLFNKPIWILSTTSASISAVSSILVIVFIVRSRQLSSAYHKIMLFMSFWDVVSSIAVSLATLPMPSDVHEIYPFVGMAIGDTTTCTAQGLVITVGFLYTMWSNCTLSFYYVCTIRYGMTDEYINARILPAMLAISTVCVWTYNVMGLEYGAFNPRPFEPFCLVGPYPHNCLEDDGVECIRGEMPKSVEMFFLMTAIVTGLTFMLCMVSSMILVIVTVYKAELAWREYDRSRYREQRGNEIGNLSAESNSHTTSHFKHLTASPHT